MGSTNFAKAKIMDAHSERSQFGTVGWEPLSISQSPDNLAYLLASHLFCSRLLYSREARTTQS